MLLKSVIFTFLCYAGLTEAFHLNVKAGGLQSKSLSSRITDGEPATPGQFPYQISLEWSLMPFLLPYSHVCGGSILNENWVLTAGHCITEIPKIGKLRINAGKFGILDAGEEQQIIEISKKVVHEEYKGGVAPFDIALLKLKSPLVFNELVAPLNLPLQDEEFDGDVVLTGWGSVSKDYLPVLPQTLQFAELPLVDYNTCKDVLEHDVGVELFQSQICTGPIGETKSACSGDSGGPLVKKVNDSSIQVGIVSWGVIPCGQGAPSVYTRVSSYVDWINSKILD